MIPLRLRPWQLRLKSRLARRGMRGKRIWNWRKGVRSAPKPDEQLVNIEYNGGRVRILIADDHDIVRLGLRQLLTAQPGWEICAEATTGEKAVTLAKQFEPQVVVMDIGMPELSGIDATRKICGLLPDTKIVVLTMHFSDQLIRDIVEAGACGYVLKSDADRDLVAAVRTVVNGGSYFTSRAADAIAGQHNRPAATSFKRRLTPREREIVQLLADGKTSKEVGVSLGISTKTAETHRSNVMRKLALHSLPELVRYAIKNKIVEA
jgi:DNA-binding NarL/FixJ family response regulator